MNWFRKNIKNISESRYVQTLLKWMGNLLLTIAVIAIIFNFVGDYSYNLYQNKTDFLGKLLSYRNSITIIFTFVWLLSLFLGKKLWLLSGWQPFLMLIGRLCRYMNYVRYMQKSIVLIIIAMQKFLQNKVAQDNPATTEPLSVRKTVKPKPAILTGS